MSPTSLLQRRRCITVTLGALLLPPAGAQVAWPAGKPISVTVSLQAGTGSDVAMRNIAEKVASSLGQQWVITNLTGASGLLAAQHVVKAPPDGYSLVALSGATLTTLPHLQKGPNPAKDLVPVAMIVSFPSVISVHARVPAQNIQEFIELVRKNPGKYTYASGGNGSVQHTAMESLKAMAGINLLHVPYKGMAQATTDLVGGHVDSAIQGVVAVIPFTKSGQVRPLAWTGATRNPLFPDLPTLGESGVRGYSFQSWTALFAPAGTPRDVVNRLNAEVRRAAAAPDLRERWLANGMEAVDMTTEQIDQLIRSESDQMAKLVRDTGMKLDQ